MSSSHLSISSKILKKSYCLLHLCQFLCVFVVFGINHFFLPLTGYRIFEIIRENTFFLKSPSTVGFCWKCLYQLMSHCALGGDKDTGEAYLSHDVSQGMLDVQALSLAPMRSRKPIYPYACEFGSNGCYKFYVPERFFMYVTVSCWFLICLVILVYCTGHWGYIDVQWNRFVLGGFHFILFSDFQ